MGTSREVRAGAATERPGRGLRGLTFTRRYSDATVPPFDAIEWELRTAGITSDKGEVIFEQKNVEVPKSWSMLATITAMKNASATCLAVDTGRCLLIDGDAVLQAADVANIAIVAEGGPA